MGQPLGPIRFGAALKHKAENIRLDNLSLNFNEQYKEGIGHDSNTLR